MWDDANKATRTWKALVGTSVSNFKYTICPAVWLRNGAGISRVGAKYLARNFRASRIVEILGTICKRASLAEEFIDPPPFQLPTISSAAPESVVSSSAALPGRCRTLPASPRLSFATSNRPEQFVFAYEIGRAHV